MISIKETKKRRVMKETRSLCFREKKVSVYKRERGRGRKVKVEERERRERKSKRGLLLLL